MEDPLEAIQPFTPKHVLPIQADLPNAALQTMGRSNDRLGEPRLERARCSHHQERCLDPRSQAFTSK